MTGPDVLTLILFAEDRGHKDALELLTDRVFLECPPENVRPWVEAEQLIYLRRWRGIEETEGYTKWTRLDDVAKRVGVRHVHGKFDGRPGAPDASMYRKALRIAQAIGHDSVVVLARDLDRARKREAYEQAVASAEWPFAVILAASDPEIEAWYVAGFEPKDPHEQARLNASRQELGFDPRAQPHKMRSTSSESKDAKRVIEKLTEKEDERLRECLTQVELAVLRMRGEHCGLRDFLVDIEKLLVPLLYQSR